MQNLQIPPITVTSIGEFIRYNSCERRFKLNIDNNSSQKIPFFDRLRNPLDVVLQDTGKAKEEAWKKSLDKAKFREIPFDNLSIDTTSWDFFLTVLNQLPIGKNAYAREVRIEGQIGSFRLQGSIDFLLITWKNQLPIFRIVECKASRKDATYQNVQVAIYRMLLIQLLNNKSVIIDNKEFSINTIECVVARIDEKTNEIQNILELPSLDLTRQIIDIEKLLSNKGKLIRVFSTDIDELPFQIEPKCDSCIFNIHCLSESARQRRLEILNINSPTIRALKENSIRSIDDLAQLDTSSNTAHILRNDNSFSSRLETLVLKAKARKKNLPPILNEETNASQDSYDVNAINQKVHSQLPEYEQNGNRLVRVYMSVTLDYVEKRIVALAAHITKSDKKIITKTSFENGKPIFDTEIKEKDNINTEFPISGEYIQSIITKKWTHKYDTDSAYEELTINNFLEELHKAIRKVAAVGKDGEAPVHFYFWSRQELRNLVEACSRSAESRLLGHLQQLMGCRESLEQLIYSCLQDEVKRRYVLGWTGLGLSVVTSLSWFGQRYHWTRNIDGEIVHLDKIFTQDIFDFKTDLWVTPQGNWANPEYSEEQHHSKGNNKYKFEIRSRFNDGLTPPYFYAYWDALPDDSKFNSQVKSIVQRYRNAKDYIEAFIEARIFALRWIEEKITPKNSEIEKPLLKINELKTFDLNINSVARASIDFLRFDYHIKFTDWVANHFEPPIDRVAEGKSLPLRHVSIRGNQVSAIIDTDTHNTNLETLLDKATSFEVGSFVRLTRCFDDPNTGQSKKMLLYGRTCKIDRINEVTGEINLAIIPSRESRYMLSSSSNDDTMEYATLDESISDFISGRVENRLLNVRESSAYEWLTPIRSDINIPERHFQNDLEKVKSFLSEITLVNGNKLAEDQLQAIIENVDSKIHLLQGPPGTGKSTTTSISVLTKILLNVDIGNLVIISANTHTAVDTLLRKIDDDIDIFNGFAKKHGLVSKPIIQYKLHTSTIDNENSPGGRIIDISSNKLNVTELRKLSDRICIIGGTTGGVLKFVENIVNKPTYPNSNTPLLVIDEASMLIFPHFLSLATFVRANGEIMLAGDHRQLSPIVAHDWENEDRPPIMLYKPYVSSYQAIWDIRTQIEDHIISKKALEISKLSQTFRLPFDVVNLIARLYRIDGIDLQGNKTSFPTDWEQINCHIWDKIWRIEEGIFLITHNERQSKKSNLTEVDIIKNIMIASKGLPDNSTAIVTPHRAQRSLLKKNLTEYNNVIDIIETVEKLQGGERDNIIVSATASDSSAIGSYTEFILNLNRANVAFSRPKKKLIVICAEELLNYIPSDSKLYETAMLWKEMRNYCNKHLGSIVDNGFEINLFTS